MNSHDVMLSWTAEGDKRLQEARASGSKLQLTHMALGNASTPLSITDLKQAREVRSVIYQAPLDGVTVDREKNSVIGELILPEDKKEEAIREIGIFELDTLVAVGYSSSPYRDVRQQSGERIQLVRLPLNTIPASAIETLSNVINFKESDTRYLHAAENLKDLTNKKTARSNFELGTAAVKNAGTNHSDLITTGEADNRYLKHSENLLATKADKADVSKHSQFFHLFVDDPDVLAYLLQPGLTSDQLEAWLASDNNEEKFTRLFTHSVAIQIIISNSAAFTMLVNSPRAIKAAVKSQAMLVAMVSAEPALAVVVNSQTVMNAVANSRAALDVIGMSTLACQAIEEGQYQVPMIADLGKKIDRKNMAIAVVGNKAIFLGGKTTSPSATIDIYDSQDNYSATIDIYDSQDNSWTTHTASEARYLAEVAVVGNKAIFFGGKTASPSATIDIYDSQDNNSATIDIYDSQDNSWTTHTASEARYLATVAVVGNKAIFFGGETTNIYDSQGNSWTTHKASEARYLATVAVVGNKAIFFGGKTGNDNYSATIDIYDSQGNSWTTHTASEARYLAGVAVVGNKAIFFGGYTTSFTATIDIYDSQDNSWTTHTASEAHYLVTVAVVGNKAIFLGGKTGNDNYDSATIDIYHAASGTWRAVSIIRLNSDYLCKIIEKNKAVFIGRDVTNDVKKYTYLDTDNNGLITRGAADDRYLNVSDNLNDLVSTATARSHLGLKTGAIKDVDTDDNGLITQGAADKRYLNKNSENLLFTQEDKADVSKHTQFFQLFFGDPDGLAYLLRPGLKSDQLEAWLANDNNGEKFTDVVASQTAMNAVAASQIAMNAVATSSTTREILRNSSTAMAEVGKNSMAIAKLTTGLAGLNPLDYADMAAVAASKTAMDAVAGSAIALNAIVKSELASKAIEVNLQSPRITVQSTLNAASGIFKKTNETIGSGGGSWESGANSATIYIPTSSNDNANGMHDNDYYVYSLLPGNRQLAFIPKHSGAVNVTSGLALRGVRVQGLNVGSSTSETGNVTFDVYTAV